MQALPAHDRFPVVDRTTASSAAGEDAIAAPYESRVASDHAVEAAGSAAAMITAGVLPFSPSRIPENQHAEHPEAEERHEPEKQREGDPVDDAAPSSMGPSQSRRCRPVPCVGEQPTRMHGDRQSRFGRLAGEPVHGAGQQRGQTVPVVTAAASG